MENNGEEDFIHCDNNKYDFADYYFLQLENEQQTAKIELLPSTNNFIENNNCNNQCNTTEQKGILSSSANSSQSVIEVKITTQQPTAKIEIEIEIEPPPNLFYEFIANNKNTIIWSAMAIGTFLYVRNKK